MNGVLQYLIQHPLLLAPILVVAAALVFAILKRLLKVAVILLIAGALYVLLVRYMGGL
jgi:hypothetical protein